MDDYEMLTEREIGCNSDMGVQWVYLHPPGRI